MLLYCQQFCNIFSASSAPAWQGRGTDGQCRGHSLRVAVAWRALGLPGPARIKRSLQARCHTPSIPHLHVARTYSPLQRSTARMWQTFQSASLLDTHPCTRRHPPHVLAKAAMCHGTTDGFAMIVLEHKHVVHVVLRTYWRSFHVPTGEVK